MIRLLALGLLALAGCHGSARAPERPAPAASPAALQGRWEKPCASAPEQRISALGSFTVNGAEFRRDVRIYSDDECKSADTIRIQVRGRIDAPTEPEAATGRVPVDLRVDSELVTLDRGSADFANAHPDAGGGATIFCGYTDWREGIPRDIAADAACMRRLGAFPVEYTTLRVRGDTLVLGKPADARAAQSPATRQLALDESQALTRARSVLGGVFGSR